jgi:hypothetical protein
VIRRAALLGALLATLRTPATWPLALATFLIRGGIVLVLVPIVVLPTTVGIGNVFGPALASIAFGSFSGELVGIAVVSLLAVVGWLVIGGWLAAVLEVETIRMVAVDDDVPSLGGPAEGPASRGIRPSDRTARVAAQILAARAVAFIPLAVALAFGGVRIVLVAYRELTSPLDTSTPIVQRVLGETPEVIIAVVLAWMVGEMIGAIAARRIVLAGDGVGSALRLAIGTCLRHPLSNLVRFWLPTVVLFVVAIAGAVAAGSAWSAVGDLLAGSGDVTAVFAIVVVFVVVWLVGLALIALVSAWRAAVWTVAEIAREGTFGGSTDRRPGDWRADRSSATL